MYTILNIPKSDIDNAITVGAFYSNLLDSWCISTGLLNYPQSRKKIFRPWVSGEVFEPESESKFKALLVESLFRDFNITQEVAGTHWSGKSMFIDLVMKPKITKEWKNKNIALAFELKSPVNLESKNDWTNWATQTIDYSQTKWDGFGYLPVFLGPGYEHVFKTASLGNIPLIADLLYAMRIGYSSLKNGFQIYMSHSKVWCQAYGVQNMGQCSDLLPLYGSR